MAAVTVTSITTTQDTVVEVVQAAAAITAGQSCYLNSASKWDLADANDTEETAGSLGVGIALSPAPAADDWFVVARGGTVLINTGLTKGTQYIVGATPGSIHPDADAASGWFKTLLGIAGTENATTTYDELPLNIVVSGQALA